VVCTGLSETGFEVVECAGIDLGVWDNCERTVLPLAEGWIWDFGGLGGLGGLYPVVFGEDFRHAEEISCGIFDVCRSFDEEIVDYLGRGDRSLYRIDKISRLVTSIILNNINNMSHPRFHKTKLHVNKVIWRRYFLFVEATVFDTADEIVHAFSFNNIVEDVLLRT
jgi:hypothetical protein